MPDAIITSTASTFGTISGTFAADQSTITGTVSGIVPGTLSGSVGVPGPAGSPGAPGPGVPAGGTAGQYLQKIDGVDYNTDWVTLNLSGYALLSGADFTGRVTVPGITGDEIVNFPGFNIVPTQTEPTDKVDGDLWVYDDEGLTPSKFRVFLAGSTYNVATESWVSSLYAPLASPVFTGDPRAPTPASGDNDTSIATTAFVKAQGYAPLASPAFTGNPTAPTAALADNDTSLATTAFVQQELLSGTANARNLEVYVRNQTGSTIPAGSIVYINGATGNRPTITLAQANNDANSAQTFGFTKTAIANNGFGFVIVRGELENVDTSALTEGVQLYLSPTTAGAYTTTKPSAPQHLVYVGICVRAHPTQGVILVAIQNGYELGEIHDIQLGTLANNDLLAYESSTDLWKNKTFSALGLLTSSSLTGYALESWVTAGFYPLTGNPSSFLVAADIAGKANIASPSLTGTPLSTTAAVDTNTTQIATTAFVVGQASAVTPLVNGTAAIGTSLRYARADHVHPTDTTRAPLASPAFTGTPSLPTGTTAVTQTAGNNTTAVATTAFVTAAVPAFATLAEISAPTSTNKVVSPWDVVRMITNRASFETLSSSPVFSTSGTGAEAYKYSNDRLIWLGTPNATVSGWGQTIFETTIAANGLLGAKRGSTFNNKDFNKKIIMSGTVCFNSLGDANTVFRMMLGGRNTTTNGDPTRESVGFKVVGGGSNAMRLVTYGYNGSTSVLTETVSSFTPVVNQTFDWMIYHEPDPSVAANSKAYLYINDSLVATGIYSPSTQNVGSNYMVQTCETTASHATRMTAVIFPVKIWWSR